MHWSQPRGSRRPALWSGVWGGGQDDGWNHCFPGKGLHEQPQRQSDNYEFNINFL